MRSFIVFSFLTMIHSRRDLKIKYDIYKQIILNFHIKCIHFQIWYLVIVLGIKKIKIIKIKKDIFFIFIIFILYYKTLTKHNITIFIKFSYKNILYHCSKKLHVLI